MALIDDLKAALGTSYIIERELGGGGMSRVFAGEEVALGRKVAIKVLAPELAAGLSADRFQREIKLAAQLQHPNIVPVLTTGVAAGLPYYTMPFVDGLSLRQRLERNSGVPMVEVIGILRDVARALTYAHDHGIVHRDIKPENILLHDEAAVVTDFGIAKALAAARTDAPGGTLTQAGTSLGTPAYMAPEQISADPHVDHRADIYSFGCVAYELLTGAAPFAHRLPHQLYAAHITEKPALVQERRPDCPPEVAAMVMQCLEKDPENRPQTARETLRSLDSSRSVDATQSAYTAKRPATQKPLRRGRLIVASAIAGVAVFSAVAAYATRGKQSADIHSLAVLPFQNIGGDTANAYFAEGMSDELTTELARVPGITLASRSAVARLKDSDPAKIGTALDVGGVIDGTVRRYGNQLKLTAELTNASSGKVIWTDSYQKQVNDVFAVEDTIAKEIASTLKIKLNGGGEAEATANLDKAHGTSDVAAYDLYLKAQYLLGRRGTSLYSALKLFEEATKKDPKFARAYAGYAMTASLLPSYTKTPSDSIIPLGVAAAKRAVELDPNLADAHLGLANLQMYNFRWDLAQAEYKRAIEIDPTNATAWQWYGDVLYAMGKARDALPYEQKALSLEPSSPVKHTDVAYVLMITGHYTQARSELGQSLELDSALVFNEGNLANLFYLEGQYDSVAVIDHRRFLTNTPLFRLASMIKQKNTSRARSLQDTIVARLTAPHGDDSGAGHAMLYSILNEKDSAFYWLNRAIDRKAGFLFTGGLPCFTLFENLASDPRWDEALKRINAVRCQR